MIPGERNRKKTAKVKGCVAKFRLKYAPGKLEAVAFDAMGKELARSELVSAEAPLAIQAAPEKKTVKAGEVVYVPVTLEGRNGVVESNTDRRLSVSVEGGELLGFGSANPRTAERFAAGEYSTYYGRALAVVRAGQAGTVKLTVSDGEKTAVAEIAVR